MRNVTLRYLALIGALLFIFGGFIACGSQLYQVSMDKDFDESKAPAESRDPTSTAYGIHAMNGWTQLPIEFRFGKDVNQMQKLALSKAMRTWERVVGKTLFKNLGTDSQTGASFPNLYSSLSDGINGHYMEKNWAKTEKPVVVLATTIWDTASDDGSQISAADIHFNSEYYNIGDSLFLTAVDGKEVVDMESLALHELGHLLGLAHVDASVDYTSIMNPQLFIGEGLTSRKVSKGDIQRIQQIYGCKDNACDVDAILQEIELNVAKETNVSNPESAAVQRNDGTSTH